VVVERGSAAEVEEDEEEEEDMDSDGWSGWWSCPFSALHMEQQR
jgi:ferredoxin